MPSLVVEVAGDAMADAVEGVDVHVDEGGGVLSADAAWLAEFGTLADYR